MIRSKLSKLAVIFSFALLGLGALHGSAFAAADGDLDITTLPPEAQWRINPAIVAHIPVEQVIVVKGQ